jgi:hypothetical protein
MVDTPDTPFCFTAHVISTATYRLKAGLLSPMAGHTSHRIGLPADLMQKLQTTIVSDLAILIASDVTALFTDAPFNGIKKKTTIPSIEFHSHNEQPLSPINGKFY